MWSNAYSEIGPEVRCDLSRLLARKVTKRINSSKPASLNHPTVRVWEGGGEENFLPKNTIIALVLSSLSLRSYTSTWRGGDLGLADGCQFWEMGVSTWLVKDRVLFSESRKRSCIKNKEYRSKDWSLWNTEWDGSWLRGEAVDTNKVWFASYYKNQSKAMPCIPKPWWS